MGLRPDALPAASPVNCEFSSVCLLALIINGKPYTAAAVTSPECVFGKVDSSRARLERMVWSGWGFRVS